MYRYPLLEEYLVASWFIVSMIYVYLQISMDITYLYPCTLYMCFSSFHHRSRKQRCCIVQFYRHLPRFSSLGSNRSIHPSIRLEKLSQQEPESLGRGLNRHRALLHKHTRQILITRLRSGAHIDCALDPFAAVKLLIQADQDNPEDRRGTDGDERRGRADAHGQDVARPVGLGEHVAGVDGGGVGDGVDGRECGGAFGRGTRHSVGDPAERDDIAGVDAGHHEHHGDVARGG